MDHCGNRFRQTGDLLLSYRTPVKTDDGISWIPRLTFVLNTKIGMLGEMKGYKNQKPSSKYHDVIIALLKHPMVKGIRGGGYEPQNNFKMDDLPNDIVMELVQEKPGLMNVVNRFQMAKTTEEQTQIILDTLRKEFHPSMERWKGIARVMNTDENGNIVLYDVGERYPINELIS